MLINSKTLEFHVILSEALFQVHDILLKSENSITLLQSTPRGQSPEPNTKLIIDSTLSLLQI